MRLWKVILIVVLTMALLEDAFVAAKHFSSVLAASGK